MTASAVRHEDLTGEDRGIRVLRIDRPAKRNALNLRVKAELVDELHGKRGDSASSGRSSGRSSRTATHSRRRWRRPAPS